jgi:hypothetical protein
LRLSARSNAAALMKGSRFQIVGLMHRLYGVGEFYNLVSPHPRRSNQGLLAHNIKIIVVLNKANNYFIVATEVEIIGSSVSSLCLLDAWTFQVINDSPIYNQILSAVAWNTEQTLDGLPDC